MERSNRKYAVVLTPEARQRLESITRNGRAPAKKMMTHGETDLLDYVHGSQQDAFLMAGAADG